MPRQLTPEQLEDAQRLDNAVQAWLRTKGGKRRTQVMLGELVDLDSSTISQYLKGRIGLNVAALLKLCAALRCHPESISPTLWNEWQDLRRCADIATASSEAANAPPAPGSLSLPPLHQALVDILIAGLKKPAFTQGEVVALLGQFQSKLDAV